MSEPVKIGGDWVENVDEATVRKYYANTVTQVRKLGDKLGRRYILHGASSLWT